MDVPPVPLWMILSCAEPIEIVAVRAVADPFASIVKPALPGPAPVAAPVQCSHPLSTMSCQPQVADEVIVTDPLPPLAPT